MQENPDQEIFKSPSNKTYDNINLTVIEPNTKMEIPVVLRVPIEIWDMILFQNLNPGEDLYSLYNASSIWSIILEGTKLQWMFVQVLPLIVQQLSKKDVLKCREVCKRWRYGVDYFLENNVVQRPFTTPVPTRNLQSLQDWFTAEKLEYSFGSSEQKIDLLKHALDHPNNPLVGKSVSVQYDEILPMLDGQENGKCKLGIKFLQRFGSHIHFLRIRFHQDRPEQFLEKLVQLFELANLSNLKKIEINFWSVETNENESIVEEQLQDHINSLTDQQKSHFPKYLETLNITGIYGFCSSKLHQIIVSLFFQSLKSLIKWNTKPKVFPRYIQLANLSHLALSVGSPETLESLLALNSPLQRLCLHYTINDLHCNELFIKAINHFQGTIRNLELHILHADSLSINAVAPFTAIGGLILPHIKSLTFSNFLPPSFNLICELQSLENMHLDVYPCYMNKNQFRFFDALHPEKLDLGACLQNIYIKTNSKPQSFMYKSNVWKTFKQLNVLCLSGLKAGEKLELRRDIHEKLS